ncbi:MAG: cation transporter [Rhodocyclaceae bacterium]|jgi:cation diffusion facilitator family transporter|nr:cation transporter [Rhodocyclaceae bacterium]
MMTNPPPSSAKTAIAAQRQGEGRRVTLVSVGVNVILTTMQLIVGFWAHSQSLIADAIHTLSDIVADAFVLVANHKGGEAADAEHPYGHGRYETAASLVLGLLLTVTGGGILIAAAQRVANLDSLPPVAMAAMWAALATLAGKEALFRYMLAIAERLRSPMLVANAWHARADALSSLVVAVGIGASLAGFPIADAIAAIIVGAMIARVGLRFAWDATQELIDTGLSDHEVAALRATISQTSGVLDLHELRTRRMAHQVLVDAHVRVDSRISVSEGHRIAEQARARVLEKHGEVLDVLVHVDAEDDIEPTNPEVVVPDRPVLTAQLEQWMGQPLAPDDRLVLHYLDNSVEAELTLGPASAANLAARGVVLKNLLGDPKTSRWFKTIRVSYQLFDRNAPNMG